MAHITRHPRCEPYPELAEDEPQRVPYQVRDSRDTREARSTGSDGMVDLVHRRIFVPLVPRGRATARHELAHVRWSPTKLPEVDFDPTILLVVEDARVNLALERSGLPMGLEPRGAARVVSLAAEDVDERRWAALVLRSIAALGTTADPAMRTVAAGAPPALAELVTRLRDRVRRALTSDARKRGTPEADFSVALRLAEEVARELSALDLVIPELPRCCTTCDDEAGRPGARARRSGDLDGGGVEPGTMRTVVAPLDVRVGRVRGALRAWRPAAEGSVVRYVHRHPIDGQVFRRRGRARAGTVLIDTSGSMSLGPGDVERILTEASAATQVAIYSGKEREGELRIVARGGRRAAPEHLAPFGGANVVDLPALEWLARQGAPRVWISDGRVTGVGDSSSPELRERCKLVTKRARITRVGDVAGAVKALGA